MSPRPPHTHTHTAMPHPEPFVARRPDPTVIAGADDCAAALDPEAWH